MSRLITALDGFPNDLRGGAVAIGNFDALHIGHVALVRKLVALSKEISGPALVFTFDPPPGALLRPALPRIKPLTTIDRRARLLEKLGVSVMIAYPTDTRFLQLSAEEFFSQIIIGTLGARGIVEGPDFRFGRGRLGDQELLTRLCREAGIRFDVMPVITDNLVTVSSTRVRELVTLGQVSAANRLLLEPYRIEGDVVSGAQRGRTIGFPTANLGTVPVLIPAMGVYAGRVIGIDASPRAAAIHIGPNPTFGENEPKVEVHITNWTGTLYGQRLEVELLDRVRDVRNFVSVDELQKQLRLDVAQCVQQASV